MSSLYIDGQWQDGAGDAFDSVDPATGKVIWTGKAASVADVDRAFAAAHAAFDSWARMPLSERLKPVMRFKELALAAKEDLGALIASETGKQLWDATGEGGAIAGKVDISIASYEDRTGTSSRDVAFGHANLQHRPHGVMAILGPYNYPAHLPNGQILPSLIAGNTVVFKPSEQTPAVGEALIKLYAEAGFPKGVVNMVQGARETGGALINNPHVDGVLFTGSPQTGAYIHKHFGGRPEVVLALEMGGNNPLIVWDASDAAAAASQIAQSAYITSGQRCTCARRVIVPTGKKGDVIVAALTAFIDRITVGAWTDETPATMGPLVSTDIAAQVVGKAKALVDAGATVLRETQITPRGDAFVSPGLYDVTGIAVPDEEIFGPVLQLIRVDDWDAAIAAANNTRFGLAAGLLSDNAALWDDFRARIRAGVVNFNRPTTGAASFLPFGGPGASGNHNPGAYYAADFCAWPMASQVAPALETLPMQGLKS
ncbi:succinylglutamate-semialdehyde dehydrogenase [Fretibacter rubidus]|uniref:succinylglutamate-semialdehyde dehydrogenase n=1 Tax=Fretibacter rubidus TaxID=570162 RepID=UPI00352AADCB